MLPPLLKISTFGIAVADSIRQQKTSDYRFSARTSDDRTPGSTFLNNRYLKKVSKIKPKMRPISHRNDTFE